MAMGEIIDFTFGALFILWCIKIFIIDYLK